jgi:septum formation topological specificity factor MinE
MIKPLTFFANFLQILKDDILKCLLKYWSIAEDTVCKGLAQYLK